MDSAVVLALAREQGFAVHALSVRYGQRHTSELDAADRVSQRARRGRAQDRQRRPAQHRRLGADRRHRRAADDDGHAIGQARPGRIPVTYVPARNTIMLSVALGWAEVLGAADIFCGVNAVDYSGYPGLPARNSSTRSSTWPTSPPRPASKARACACTRRCMLMSKADIVREGVRLGVDFARDRVVLPGRRTRAAPAAIATPAACAPKASPRPAWPIRRVTPDSVLCCRFVPPARIGIFHPLVDGFPSPSRPAFDAAIHAIFGFKRLLRGPRAQMRMCMRCEHARRDTAYSGKCMCVGPQKRR